MSEWINEYHFFPKEGEIYHVIGVLRDKISDKPKIVSWFYIFTINKDGTLEKCLSINCFFPYGNYYISRPYQYKKINSIKDVEENLYSSVSGINMKEYFEKTRFNVKKIIPKFDWSYC